MNEKKTVLLLILFVNWWLMTKDQEKPLGKVSALQLLVKGGALAFSWLSTFFTCCALQGLFWPVFNSKSWVLTLLQLSV